MQTNICRVMFVFHICATQKHLLLLCKQLCLEQIKLHSRAAPLSTQCSSSVTGVHPSSSMTTDAQTDCLKICDCHLTLRIHTSHCCGKRAALCRALSPTLQPDLADEQLEAWVSDIEIATSGASKRPKAGHCADLNACPAKLCSPGHHV